MSNEAKIKEGIEPVLASQNVKLFDITWTNEGKHKILQIAIEKEDGTMDIDLCASVAEVLSEKLDELNLIDYEYMLEVCSPGAERKLRNLQEVKDATGKYVYAKFKKPVGKLNEVTGTLLSVEEDVITIQYMDKTFKRQVSVNYDNCSLIRLAVKF